MFVLPMTFDGFLRSPFCEDEFCHNMLRFMLLKLINTLLSFEKGRHEQMISIHFHDFISPFSHYFKLRLRRFGPEKLMTEATWMVLKIHYS